MVKFQKLARKIPIPPVSFFKKQKKMLPIIFIENLSIVTECGLSRAKRNLNWARHAHKTAVALSSHRARAACDDGGPLFDYIFR